jgi:hypothetical protein
MVLEKPACLASCTASNLGDETPEFVKALMHITGFVYVSSRK